MSEPELNPAKPGEQWTSGEEARTGPQAGEEPPPENLTKAEASRRIDELQQRVGRN